MASEAPSDAPPPAVPKSLPDPPPAAPPPPLPPLPPPPSPPPPPSTSSMKRALGPLAIVAYLLTLPLLAFGIWLVSTHDYDCEDLLRAPNVRVAVGVGLLFVLLISNFVVYYGAKVLMPGHMVLSVVLVMMLTAGLSLVGLYKMEARGLPESPLWLRNRVLDADTWNDIKTCLYEDMICQDLTYRTIQMTSNDFSMMKLSSIEVIFQPLLSATISHTLKRTLPAHVHLLLLVIKKSGCCKPSAVCGMEYVNATNWRVARNSTRGSRSLTNPTASIASFNDCRAWNNQPNILCYSCQSCKVAFLRVITSRWRKVGVFLVAMSKVTPRNPHPSPSLSVPIKDEEEERSSLSLVCLFEAARACPPPPAGLAGFHRLVAALLSIDPTNAFCLRAEVSPRISVRCRQGARYMSSPQVPTLRTTRSASLTPPIRGS
ncbi:hypothetical protein BHM03_00014248 [Ensete ventricosum]|nr:hypothetical protein BHM03_00014248 [Ensete ventricosum]